MPAPPVTPSTPAAPVPPVPPWPIGGLFGGNVLEAIARSCTANMSNKLRSLGIPHRFNARPDGSHSWGLFSADMRLSWPMIARAIGA
ncbi:hypothetical protein [Gordonia alkaliphila]|uniref:Esterase n=1 Tax=Gordonia alkaliphila TaxID=1053547 RepID=A0ABP8Z1Q8_9ACTN